MTAIHSEIMESAGNFHREVGKASFGVAKDILDDPSTLDTRNCVFNHNARTSNDFVHPFVNHAQYFAFWLFWAGT